LYAHSFYARTQRYRTIDKLTLTTLLSAMAGVFVVSVLFLDVFSAALVVICVIVRRWRAKRGGAERSAR
jgi:hypothetical protein